MTVARKRWLAAGVFPVLATFAVVAVPRSAGADDPPDDEVEAAEIAELEATDIATPGPDVAAQLEAAGAAPILRTTAVARIEDFTYDRLLTEGTASEVCYGRLRQGTAWTYAELQRRFGGSPGTLYYCRERWNTEPDCNGTVVNPVTNPDFFSRCWSNHAQGRAFDLMVGRAGGGWNTARGRAVVNWLLAPDAAGNQNARARRLGVQQILFNDRCWNSDGDRGVETLEEMRRCGIGHFDHVHVDLTVAGSERRVSYWGATPPAPSPKLNDMFVWDLDQTGRWTTLSWDNLRPRSGASGTWSLVWDLSVVGDWDADGLPNDMFYWDRDTGSWVGQWWDAFRPANASTGRWAPGFDQVIAGDFDGNGRANDMFVWDNNTGSWQIWSWSDFTPTLRRSGRWASTWDVLSQGDLDGDGRADESFVWDRQTGTWTVLTWSGFTSSNRRSGFWSTKYDEFVIGDWDAQGALDDMLVWDRHSGAWIVQNWDRFVPSNKRSGTWSRAYDRIIGGDWDTDGRVDDMLVWDNGSGRWMIQSWRRWVPEATKSGTWSTIWDRVGAAMLGHT